MFRNFRSTLICVLIAAVVLTGLAVGGTLGLTLYRTTHRAALNELKLAARELAATVRYDLELTKSRLVSLAKVNDVVLATQSALFGGQASVMMNRFLADNALVADVYLVDREGVPRESAPPGAPSELVTDLGATLTTFIASADPGSAHIRVVRHAQLPATEPESARILPSDFALIVMTPLVSQRTSETAGGENLGALVAVFPLARWDSLLEPWLSAFAGAEVRWGNEIVLHSLEAMSDASSPAEDGLITGDGQIVLPFGSTELTLDVRLVANRAAAFAEVSKSLASTLASVVAVLALLIVATIVLARRFSLFLDALAAMVLDYAEGHFERPPPVLRFEEFDRLAQLLAGMGRTILTQLEARIERARLASEVSATRVVQESLFPPVDPCPGPALAFRSLAASQTGGDWLGYYYNERMHRLHLFVADITGHGLPAALITGVACGGVYGLEIGRELAGDHGDSPNFARYLESMAMTLNRLMCFTGTSQKLITLCALVLDCQTGELGQLCAGHPAPLIWHKQRNGLEVLSAQGPILGFQADANFAIATTRLEIGDRVLAYTDGLFENRGAEGKALKAHFAARMLGSAATADAALTAILAEGRSHWGERPLTDDVTALVLEWRGPANPQAMCAWARRRLQKASTAQRAV